MLYESGSEEAGGLLDLNLKVQKSIGMMTRQTLFTYSLVYIVISICEEAIDHICMYRSNLTSMGIFILAS